MNSANTISDNSNPDEVNQQQRQRKIKKRRFRCRECMKMFSSKQSLREHKYSHTDSKPYECLECNKRFRYGSQLTIHKKKHLSDPDVNWPTLTQLLKLYKPPNESLVRLIEIIRLPQISPVNFTPLPSFNSYFNLDRNN